MKKIIILSMMLVFTLVLTSFASDQWTVSSISENEMTGEKAIYAFSPSVGSTKKMDFPYSNVKARLSVGYDGKKPWVYIGFTESPNLLNTTIKDGYNLIDTRIKWDDELKNVTLTQDWGSKFMHFKKDKIIVDYIVKSDTVLLELEWYGSGTVYFRFPLNGSSKAINELYSVFENN